MKNSIIKFLIIIGALFTPMHIATQAEKIFSRLPDIAFLIMFVAFLTVLLSVIILNMEV